MRGDLRPSSRVDGDVTRVSDAVVALAPMRIGILGGDGPGGQRRSRPGWPVIGYEVVIGSRSKYRAMEARDQLVEHVARPRAAR